MVIHNGIDVQNFQKEVDVVRCKTELGLDGKKIALVMGRLTPPKGSEVLFEAMMYVVRLMPEARLLAVGAVVDKGIGSALDRLNVRDVVSTHPFVPYTQAHAFFSIADVVVVPSIYLDPFPTVNLDAMASKTPVVATIFGGSHEVVVDSKSGFLVDPTNIRNLAEKLIELLEDPDKAATFGEAGYQRLLKGFTIEKQIDAYEALYQQFLA